jgi:uncharacterized membrane protein (UPF0136 family)
MRVLYILLGLAAAFLGAWYASSIGAVTVLSVASGWLAIAGILFFISNYAKATRAEEDLFNAMVVAGIGVLLACAGLHLIKGATTMGIILMLLGFASWWAAYRLFLRSRAG